MYRSEISALGFGEAKREQLLRSNAFEHEQSLFMCRLPVLAACILCWTPQGGTRKLLSSEKHPRGPQTAPFGPGSAPATGWGVSALAFSRTGKVLHGIIPS